MNTLVQFVKDSLGRFPLRYKPTHGSVQVGWAHELRNEIGSVLMESFRILPTCMIPLSVTLSNEILNYPKINFVFLELYNRSCNTVRSSFSYSSYVLLYKYLQIEKSLFSKCKFNKF